MGFPSFFFFFPLLLCFREPRAWLCACEGRCSSTAFGSLLAVGLSCSRQRSPQLPRLGLPGCMWLLSCRKPWQERVNRNKKKKVIAEQVRISLAFGFLAPEPAHVWHADLETCLMLEFHSQLIRLPLKETLLGFAEKRRGGGEATPSCGCCAGAAQRLHSCTSHLQGLQAVAGQESSKACF